MFVNATLQVEARHQLELGGHVLRHHFIPTRSSPLCCLAHHSWHLHVLTPCATSPNRLLSTLVSGFESSYLPLHWFEYVRPPKVVSRFIFHSHKGAAFCTLTVPNDRAKTPSTWHLSDMPRTPRASYIPEVDGKGQAASHSDVPLSCTSTVGGSPLSIRYQEK